MLKPESVILNQAAKRIGVTRWTAMCNKDIFVETDRSLIARMYLQYFGKQIAHNVEFWNKEKLYGPAGICKVTRV